MINRKLNNNFTVNKHHKKHSKTIIINYNILVNNKLDKIVNYIFNKIKDKIDIKRIIPNYKKRKNFLKMLLIE